MYSCQKYMAGKTEKEWIDVYNLKALHQRYLALLCHREDE
ncbi:hypothetical protein J2T19_003568 [Paenibacillus tundrae]|uniref:Uncharacterized protein n=1 Tax=Paenibacillus tundrae TaxID=528187 RepID=A0ABT9WFS5_9BACL|nr:hypothetical protein [Paenibacillus tundrae]